MRKWLMILAAAVVVSCTSIDCPINNLVRTQFQFSNSAGDSLRLTDSLKVVSTRKDGRDTVIFKGGQMAKFHVPISNSHPEDKLVFTFFGEGLNIVDTLWIKKDDIPHFESVDCNATYFHHLTDIRHTRNCLDSVVIINPSVTNDEGVVHVYLYPKSND